MTRRPERFNFLRPAPRCPLQRLPRLLASLIMYQGNPVRASDRDHFFQQFGHAPAAQPAPCSQRSDVALLRLTFGAAYALGITEALTFAILYRRPGPTAHWRALCGRGALSRARDG